MPETLQRVAEQLHRALTDGGAEIKLSLSRETVEWLPKVIDARVEEKRW